MRLPFSQSDFLAVVVLRFVASGFTAPEIGEKLSISPKTVDTYKQRINDKLALSHRSEYVTFALSLEIIG